jgi:hypothetical protein
MDTWESQRNNLGLIEIVDQIKNQDTSREKSSTVDSIVSEPKANQTVIEQR